MNKPYSAACDRNKEPILEILKIYIPKDHSAKLLEIGSGSGQHAVHMAPHFPKLTWHTSDLAANHMGIRLWLKEAKIKNIEPPLKLKVGVDAFPKNLLLSAVYTANTFHIMSWKEVKSLIKRLGHHLRENALVFVYGPFKYEQRFTSKSNEDFDAFLKENNPQSGIRNFEDVTQAFKKAGFDLIEDHAMPANNQMLVFQRLKHT